MASGSGFAQRLKAELSARGFELLEAPTAPAAIRGAAPAGETVEVSAACRHTVDEPGHGSLGVMIPVQLCLSLAADGHIEHLSGGEPSAADVQAAGTWLGDLIANGQLDDPAHGTAVRGATHCVVTDADGRRTVRRRGFNAGEPASQ